MSKFEVKAISVVNLPGELADRTVRRKGVAVVEPHREIIVQKPGSTFIVDKTRKNELLALGAIDPKSIREIDDEKVPATEVPASEVPAIETATTEAPATETATTEAATTEAPKPVKRKRSRSKEEAEAQSEAEVEHETDGSEMI